MIFVFFKNKTAYEMRMSDWSSGVCSSDLIVDCPSAPSARGVDVERFRVERRVRYDRRRRGHFVGDRACVVGNQEVGVVDAVELPQHAEEEIGKAACRERVCPYV